MRYAVPSAFFAQDMTQAELGRRVGLTRQTIAAIEQGR